MIAMHVTEISTATAEESYLCRQLLMHKYIIYDSDISNDALMLILIGKE